MAQFEFVRDGEVVQYHDPIDPGVIDDYRQRVKDREQVGDRDGWYVEGGYAEAQRQAEQAAAGSDTTTEEDTNAMTTSDETGQSAGQTVHHEETHVAETGQNVDRVEEINQPTEAGQDVGGTSGDGDTSASADQR